MTRRDNPVTVYLTDAEKSQIAEWADEANKPISQLCRDAILEYVDRDRSQRIEDEVRDMHDKVDRLLAQTDSEHTHTSSRSTSSKHESVPETSRKIARTLYENHEMPVKDSDLELVIENNAGATERTIKQYKSQLKKRGLLYQHPMGKVWTDDREQWVKWQEMASTGQTDVTDVVGEYGMTVDDYDEIAQEIQ